jgi:hypothetical protein
MHRLLFGLCTVLTLGSTPLRAQHTDYYALLGATWASPLLSDRIVNDIEVKQGVAPSIRAGVSLPLNERFGVGVEGGFGWSSYQADERGSRTDLGTLPTVSLTANLDGPVLGRLRWRAGLGTIGYLESGEGIFLEGGTWRLLAMAGVDYRIPFRSSWDIAVGARWDTHGFSTSALEAQGFSSTQRVHRIFLGIGLARVRS